MSTSGEVQHKLSAQVEDLVRQNEEVLQAVTGQALHIITSHARRHIWQIKRVIDDPSFPHSK